MISLVFLVLKKRTLGIIIGIWMLTKQAWNRCSRRDNIIAATVVIQVFW
jgi:hypothetical protein